jgi:hypothetical protein
VTRRERERDAKPLSYIIRLCQPSSRLFYFVDKSGRGLACRHGYGGTRAHVHRAAGIIASV